MHSSRRTIVLIVCILFVVAAHVTLTYYGTSLDRAYAALASPATYDRLGAVTHLEENAQGHMSVHAGTYPARLKELVIAKEDQWFYYHVGTNPYRLLRATLFALRGHQQGGASTITEQLARTLLGHTNERTIRNKMIDLAAAFALEYTHSKEDLLRMYLDTAYLGNRVQGFETAARYYFDKPITALSESELLSLVATLSNPSRLAPLTRANTDTALTLAQTLGSTPPLFASHDVDLTHVVGSTFEIDSLNLNCPTQCTTTIDDTLTKELRALLARHLAKGERNNMTHGAIVVIKVPENEVLAIVGSPDPLSGRDGTAINMALRTRPIGSTIKPFLYLKGFECGLRPYTPVDDQELKFGVGSDQSIYPRNYDGQFRGTVLLDEALQNSLNVPTVEVLRYLTLPVCYEYLTHTLHLHPPQQVETYAYGIALGGLELDLLTLTHLFTALPKHGLLAPLIIQTNPRTPYTPPSSELIEPLEIAEPAYVSLVNAILSDRAGAVDQFGASGSLYLSRQGYAVKTGTSRDYHDSWTVGYTPEFVVGVWVGNTDNRPMAQVSGSAGAGAIWHDVMEHLFATPYYSGKALSTEGLERVPSPRGYSWGIPGDIPREHTTLLLRDALITSPHDGDVFEFSDHMYIPLHARAPVVWRGIDTTHTDAGVYAVPPFPGSYTIEATREDGITETITIEVRAAR